MKTLVAVNIVDIARTLLLLALLAAIGILFIRFIRRYMGKCIEYFNIYIQPFFMCENNRKKIVNKVIHDRRNAPYPSGFGTVK